MKQHARAMMSIPGVVGTGQGLCEGKPCIKVLVVKRTSDLDREIPKTIGGFPVVIEEVGGVKALPRE